jgi:hypothetical protein
MEDKGYYDYTMPAIYDDYNDGYGSFTPTITNKIDYAYVESNNFMHRKSLLGACRSSRTHRL